MDWIGMIYFFMILQRAELAAALPPPHSIYMCNTINQENDNPRPPRPDQYSWIYLDNKYKPNQFLSLPMHPPALAHQGGLPFIDPSSNLPPETFFYEPILKECGECDFKSLWTFISLIPRPLDEKNLQDNYWKFLASSNQAFIGFPGAMFWLSTHQQQTPSVLNIPLIR